MSTSNINPELILKSKISFSDEYKEPPTVLKVNGKPFGTLGNFSLITGQAKSKKTTGITLSIASVLLDAKKGVITSHFPENKRGVILFDTEQSKYHVHKQAKKVCSLVGDESPANFEVYSLREVSTSHRMELIRQVVAKSKNVGLVIIDGIRDLVSSINSEDEATIIADFLLQMTGQNNIHVITVLHQNKGSEMIRGHLGTELQNKAETVAVVTKMNDSKNSSTFKAVLTRDIEFDGFQFYIDEKGLPVIEDQVSVKYTKKDGSKSTPDELDEKTHQNIIDSLYLKKYSRSEIHTALKNSITQFVGQSYGNKKVDGFIEYYLSSEMLTKEGTEGSRSVKYSVTNKSKKEVS